MLMQSLLLLWRGLRLRCPRCGKGKVFSHGFTTYEKCSHCGWVYEREEGYWTGAMAVNLVVIELLIAVVEVPLAAMQVPLVPLFAVGIPLSILLPIAFYPFSKSLWMSIDFLIHPVALR